MEKLHSNKIKVTEKDLRSVFTKIKIIARVMC